ncbi:AMP-binding protein [Halobacillus sp. A5]|uniref:AMP-binding protein n=1 Tax=Halobacillus sp. A5 TaxID=2880263 RepID=UPI0020A6AFAE|nr:AMP-binding protein [Halobacillus sp. A5]
MARIGEKIRETAYHDPERTAVKTEYGSVTYEEFYQSCEDFHGRISSLLSSIKGKRIAFLLPNEPKWLEIFIAISSGGGIAIPFDPKWSAAQVSEVLLDAQPDLFIYDQSVSTSFDCSRSIEVNELNVLASIITKHADVSDQDPFYIGYTSGTTGQPKGFIRSHASWADCFSLGGETFSLSEQDHMLCPGPLVHSHFLYAAVQCLHMGAALHLPAKFDAEKVWTWLHTEDISVIYIVPTMFEALKRVIGDAVFPDVKALISSGAKWVESSKQSAIHVFPTADIYEFYGASELSFVSYRLVDEDGLYEGSIGQPFPRVEIAILTEDGQPVKKGEVGQLFVSSPWVFDGYLNRPEETKKVFFGKWATVGDLAFVNENGHIILKGRRQNMIISGGLNIYPEEVEETIRRQPAIEEAAVIGLEDAYWGEKVVAFVTCKKGQTLQIEEMNKQLAKWLPRYKCPKEWVELGSFPYTSSGKIARKQLRTSARRD